MAASVVMIGATGAVGGEVCAALRESSELERLTLLGRREADGLDDERIAQSVVDLARPESYGHKLAGHDVAICTLGVGEPSKMKKADFKRIDHDMVLTFAKACASAGVPHFQLLSSIGVSASSSSFYLRTKGELEQGLRALRFKRLSLFHPSMILTPTNRYGISQAITLRVWPWLTPVLQWGLRPFRGVRVADLGRSIALNSFRHDDEAVEVLEWDDFQALSAS
ncbi:MAG: NAD(P)H-binding protein [Polyangiales bacterium]